MCDGLGDSQSDINFYIHSYMQLYMDKRVIHLISKKLQTPGEQYIKKTCIKICTKQKNKCICCSAWRWTHLINPTSILFWLSNVYGWKIFMKVSLEHYLIMSLHPSTLSLLELQDLSHALGRLSNSRHQARIKLPSDTY